MVERSTVGAVWTRPSPEIGCVIIASLLRWWLRRHTCSYHATKGAIPSISPQS